MSDRVFSQEIEDGHSEMPVTIANEMPGENEIAVDKLFAVRQIPDLYQIYLANSHLLKVQPSWAF